MFKKIIKSILKKVWDKSFNLLISTRTGEALLVNKLYDHPRLCIEAFGKRNNLSQRFENVTVWPDKVGNFEDLLFLFGFHQLNMGIANLALDEAAYLHKTIRCLKSANIVEIGRFKGGGTLLMAAAMDKESHLRSYDMHVKMPEHFNGQQMDCNLLKALDRYGLSDRVDIIVGNSQEIDVGRAPIDLIFLDGDHSYEGVKKDFLNWHKIIKPGGHLLFHDAAKPREFTTYHEEVARFLKEMEKEYSKDFYKVKEVGSIAHYIKK